MIALEGTVISDSVLDRKFVCDLKSCKGQCCISGDTGAPLEKEEVNLINQDLETIQTYMTSAGIKAIKEQGAVQEIQGLDYTTLIKETGACAFVFYDNHGIAKCAIEAAHHDKKINFKKPISCHLYPIRITKYLDFDAVNYHEQAICNSACQCGEQLNVKVYKFLKEPLIRKYGIDWYKKLEAIDQIS